MSDGAISLILDQDLIEKYLSDLDFRIPESESDTNFEYQLGELKKDAVACDDQALAKQIWCYETIREIQNNYINAFYTMREHYFYNAWCSLADIENSLYSLERHFDFLADAQDRFKLILIKNHTEQFQSLYPYGLFGSPGFIALEKRCSICNEIVQIRKPCGHAVGEIYNGEQCGRLITKATILEVSFVESPVQKYSVIFALIAI